MAIVYLLTISVALIVSEIAMQIVKKTHLYLLGLSSFIFYMRFTFDTSKIVVFKMQVLYVEDQQRQWRVSVGQTSYYSPNRALPSGDLVKNQIFTEIVGTDFKLLHDVLFYKFQICNCRVKLIFSTCQLFRLYQLVQMSDRHSDCS